MNKYMYIHIYIYISPLYFFPVHNIYQNNNSSQTVHGCFFSYGSLLAHADHRAPVSDLSSCLHCMVVLGPASESATLAGSYGFNQQFSPRGQPWPAASCTLMSPESQAGPSHNLCCSSLPSSSQHSRNSRTYRTTSSDAHHCARLVDRIEEV